MTLLLAICGGFFCEKTESNTEVLVNSIFLEPCHLARKKSVRILSSFLKFTLRKHVSNHEKIFLYHRDIRHILFPGFQPADEVLPFM